MTAFALPITIKNYLEKRGETPDAFAESYLAECEAVRAIMSYLQNADAIRLRPLKPQNTEGKTVIFKKGASQ